MRDELEILGAFMRNPMMWWGVGLLTAMSMLHDHFLLQLALGAIYGWYIEVKPIEEAI